MATDLIDVIAGLDETEFNRLRAKAERDAARLRQELAVQEAQVRLFELAAAKRDRKRPGRPGTLSAEVVLEAAKETEPPFTAAAVNETLSAKGLKATVNAVRNHLNRLAKEGHLDKHDGGTFSVSAGFIPASPAGDFPTSIPDEDIPF